MSLYHEQFLEKHDLPESEVKKVLIIASNPRCGSHMLGHSLYETGCFGFPLEYVNPVNLAEWKKRFNVSSVKEVINELKKRRTSANGVFAIKLHYSHIQELGGFEYAQKLFPDAYYLLLTRRNLLKQAISYAIAKQTGVWIDGQESRNDNPVYHYEQVESCLKETIKDNASWQYLLSASGCRVIDMDFDRVKNNIPESINRIAEFMEVEVEQSEIPAQPVTQKQSKSINQTWERQFKADFNLRSELLTIKDIPLYKKVIKKFL